LFGFFRLTGFVGQFFRGVCSKIDRFPDGFGSNFPLKNMAEFQWGGKQFRGETIG
jgi:hypothetical protein